MAFQEQSFGRLDGDRMAGGPMDNDSKPSIDLIAYLLLLKSRARFILLCTAIAAASTFLIAKFFLTPYYRATAQLRPNPPDSVAGQLTGANGFSLSASLFGENDPQLLAAEEYMGILRSFDFTMALVAQHNLTHLVAPRSRKPLTEWSIYERFGERFFCEYDRTGGELKVHFIDPDPATAKRVLGFYIKGLSDKLRQADAKRAAAAVAALQEAVSQTTDQLLQTRLYELIAHQLEQQKVAHAEADFVFKTVQTPVVPDNPFRPRVMLDTAMAAMLALFLTCFGIVVVASINPDSVNLDSKTESPASSRNAIQLELQSTGKERVSRTGAR